MVYTLPKFKLVNSFKLKNIINNKGLQNNEYINLYADIALTSSSPLPCMLFYFKLRNSLAVFSINGHFIKEEAIDFEIVPNGIKVFTDHQFIDYLLIYNKKNESIDIYNIIDLKKVMFYEIKNYIFIDFIFTKELDTLYVLVNDKISIKEQVNDNENVYKILVLNSSNLKAQYGSDAINRISI